LAGPKTAATEYLSSPWDYISMSIKISLTILATISIISTAAIAPYQSPINAIWTTSIIAIARDC